MSRKIIWTFVACFAAFVLISNYPISVPCEQCGEQCIEECVMARVACNFQDNFLHFECVDAWCEDHPIHFDENGNIIRRD